MGGLGLGYTAAVALEDKRISKLSIVEYLDPVISWHQKGLVPMGDVLTSDSRCSFVHADFFELAKNVKGSFDPESPLKKYDAILLDIDHTPTNLLSVTNKHFYTLEGLAELATHIKPDGVFSLWADGAPEESFADHLGKVFVDVKAHAIEFANPVNGSTSVGAVYVSRVKNSK